MFLSFKPIRGKYYICKKSVLYGLFVFLTFISLLETNAQDNSEQGTFIDEVNAMMDHHYFENPDSALYYLDNFLIEASDNGWKNELLFALINKAYVAEHHFMIDSLDYYLDQADSVVYQYQSATDSIKLGSELVQEVSYMRGMYYYYQGDFSNALGNFKKTIFDNESLVISDSLQTFNSLINICQLSIMDGDYQNALQYAVTARQVLPVFHSSYNSVRDHNYQLAFIESIYAKILYHQNTIRNEVEAYDEVIRMLRKSLNLLKGKENTPGVHNLYLKIYMQLADAYVGINNYEGALSSLKKGLQLSEQADSEQQMKLLFETAAIYSKMNTPDAALKYIEKGQLLAEDGVDGGNRFKARASYEKGNVFILQKKWSEALAAYQNALQYLAGSTEKMDIYQMPQIGTETLESEFLKVLLLKADGFRNWYVNEGEKKYLLASIESYEQAAQLIDHIRMGFQSAESKQFLASVMLSTFESGLQAAFNAYEISSDPLYLEKAFYFSEKSRANQLTEAVRDMSSKRFAGVPEALIEEENQLKGRIYYWQQSLLEPDRESPQKKERHSQLLQAREKYRTFIETLEEKYPEYHQLKYKSATVSLEQLKNDLEPEQAVVEYFYGDYDLYIFGISQNKAVLKKMASNKTLDEQLLTALNELKNPPTADSAYQHYLNVSRELYQTLIEPIKEVLPTSGGRLLFITDGLLGYLPFETLVEPRKRVGTAPIMLLNKYSVGYDYSATLMKEKEKMARNNDSNTYLGFAPEYGDGLLARNDRSFLSKLKFNDQEVRRAYAHFGGKVFLSQTATEGNFRDNAAEASILHLSMHARVDDLNPNSSAFYFAGTEVSTKQEDYRSDNILHLYELYNMPLKANLVVLSACETGIGRYARGEGIMSLGRAFQFAGCPSVTMSLWSVNDRSSASIMENFFFHLSEGMPKDEALRQAKLSFINDPQNKYFAHPYYWSAFTLMGDPAPVAEKQYPTYLFLVIILVVLALVAAVAFYRYRKA